jgi:hypothetical protein
MKRTALIHGSVVVLFGTGPSKVLVVAAYLLACQRTIVPWGPAAHMKRQALAALTSKQTTTTTNQAKGRSF